MNRLRKNSPTSKSSLFSPIRKKKNCSIVTPVLKRELSVSSANMKSSHSLNELEDEKILASVKEDLPQIATYLSSNEECNAQHASPVSPVSPRRHLSLLQQGHGHGHLQEQNQYKSSPALKSFCATEPGRNIGNTSVDSNKVAPSVSSAPPPVLPPLPPLPFGRPMRFRPPVPPSPVPW